MICTRHLGPRRRPEALLPMINIVFLLLVFFTAAGALENADPFRVEPPLAAEAGPAERDPDLLLLDRTGRLALAGEEIDESALGPAVGRWLQARPGGALRLKADGQVPAERVVQLLERLRELGVTRVLLLTLEAPP